MKILGFHMPAVETLISINALMFVFTVINAGLVYSLFALQPATVLKQPWTIITSMFLHAGFMHIMFNMFALYFFGIYLERIVGEKDFLKLYLLGGIVGSILYVLSAFVLGIPGLDNIAVGASGAIFAVAGALAMLRPHMKVVMIPIFIPIPLYIAVFGFMVLLSFMPGVAWQGHLGGLLVGVLFGYKWKKKMVEIVGVQGKYGYKFY